MPEEINLTASERSFTIESSYTEIADFTEQTNSLVLHYFLITEQLTLIDSIGDRLLLTKGIMTKALQEGTVVQNTFSINLNESYEIIEYTRIILAA